MPFPRRHPRKGGGASKTIWWGSAYTIAPTLSRSDAKYVHSTQEEDSEVPNRFSRFARNHYQKGVGEDDAGMSASLTLAKRS